jgi:hypothetical protein
LGAGTNLAYYSLFNLVPSSPPSLLRRGVGFSLGEKGTEFFFPQGGRDLPSSPARKGLSYLLSVKEGERGD